jgi:serine protease Do
MGDTVVDEPTDPGEAGPRDMGLPPRAAAASPLWEQVVSPGVSPGETSASMPSSPPTVPGPPAGDHTGVSRPDATADPDPLWRPSPGSDTRPPASDTASYPPKTPEWLSATPAPGWPTTGSQSAPRPAPSVTPPWFDSATTAPTGPPTSPPSTPPGFASPQRSSAGVPPAPADRGRQRAGRGSVLLAALVGALVASVVSIGAMAVFDDNAVEQTTSSAPLVLAGEELDIGALLNKAQPSVVSIRTGSTSSQGVFGGAGSGVIISEDGLVLTNAHVLGNATTAEVTLFDGETRQAVLVGSAPEDDVALIAMVDPPPVVPAELGNSADVRVGDSVVAIGNALDLGGTPSVTQGIVSAKDRVIQAPGGLVLENLIQTDAAINPGNSGGPLLNALGQVVGINTAIISDAQNIGFAIAIDAVKPLIDEIKAGGGTIRADQAFLGVSMVAVEDLLDATRAQYGVTVDRGVFVTELVPNSAAAQAGLELGDVILEVDGEPVRTPSDVATIIRSMAPGDTITLLVDRAGDVQEIEAVLTQRAGTGG